MELFRLFGTIGLNGVEETQNDIQETTEQAEQSETRMSGAFKKIGQAVITYLAVDKIIDFGKSIVDASATVSAEVSAFEQIMGDYSDNAQQKLDEIANQTGVVSSRLTPYMTSMTAKFKGLGYDINEATTLASDGLLLASDASAFWDKSLEDSMGALNSFINGSYEGGEAIGLFANDTQLASYAVKEGIVKESKEWANLDEAQKQATRLEYAQKMFEMSGATGQASKEADQYANVQANLNEKWRQFKAQIGEPLLQNVVLPAMATLSGLVDNLSIGYEKLTTWINENETAVKLIGVAIGTLTTLIIAYNVQQALAMAGTTLWGVVAGTATGITTALGTAFAFLTSPIGLVILAIGSIIAVGVLLYQHWDEVKQWAIDLWNSITETFNNIATSISEKWEEIKQSVIDTWNTITEFLSNAWETIKNIVQVGLMFLGELFNLFIDILLIPWNFIWVNFGEQLTQAWTKMTTTVNNALTSIKDFITNIMTSIQQFFINIWNAISGYISNVMNTIKTNIMNAWNSVKAFLTPILNAISSFISNTWNSIKSKITSVMNAIKTTISNIWNDIKNTITNIINAVNNTVSNIVNSIKTTVSNVFNSVKNTVTNVWNSIKTAIETPINNAKNAVKNAIETMKGFFNFSWSLPKLKMPHISIKGEFSLMPPKVPSFGIEWYKDGGIMTQPTLFGMNPFTQKAMVGGEAGPEAIAPISTLSDYVKIAVKEENEGLIYYIQKMIEMLNDYLEQIVNNIDRPIILEDGTLVSKLAPQIDQKLGDINKGRGRGR